MDASRFGGRVVVGIDGSPSALQAAQWAVREARRRVTPLRLVIAFTWGEYERRAGDPPRRLNHRDVLLAQAREHLAVAAKAVARIDPDSVVERQLIVGPASDVLVAEAERAQLLVLGSNDHSRIGSLFAGSVAVGTAARATCPVVVVRGRDLSQDPALPVVVGVDGSEAAEKVLEFAFAVADSRGSPLHAVHALRAPHIDPAIEHAVLRGTAEGFADHTIADQVARWSDKYPDVAVTSIVAQGRITDLLLGRAKAAQLVVVGSRGRRPAAAAVLGSVSAALVHRCPCPVAIVGPAAISAAAPDGARRVLNGD